MIRGTDKKNEFDHVPRPHSQSGIAITSLSGSDSPEIGGSIPDWPSRWGNT